MSSGWGQLFTERARVSDAVGNGSHRTKLCKVPDPLGSSGQGRVCRAGPGPPPPRGSCFWLTVDLWQEVNTERRGNELPDLWHGLKKKVTRWIRCVSAFGSSGFHRAFEKRTGVCFHPEIISHLNCHILENTEKWKWRGGESPMHSTTYRQLLLKY